MAEYAALAALVAGTGMTVMRQRAEVEAAEDAQRARIQANRVQQAQVEQARGAARQTVALQYHKLAGELRTASHAAYINSDSVSSIDRERAALSQASIEMQRADANVNNQLFSNFATLRAGLSQLQNSASVNYLEAGATGLQLGSSVYSMRSS